MKKFCIIAVDYEHHVPRGEQKPSIQHGLKSLALQTFQDFNLIICHDGPKEKTYEEEGIVFNEIGVNPIILNTPEKMADWGHSSRDMAMRYAYENNLGEYYIQFNIDNLLNKDALKEINNALVESTNPIVIFSIYHHKHNGGMFMSGVPPVRFKIDALQMVAHKEVWKKNNFWYDKRNQSDGFMYEWICKQYRYAHIPKILGENF